MKDTVYTHISASEVAEQPFPDLYGLSLYNKDRSSLEVRPVRTTETTLDGTKYTETIISYDALARALTTKKSGPYFSRIDSIEYKDNLQRWILGGVARETNVDTGNVSTETSFDANLMPVEVRSFGKVVQKATYNADGTVASLSDGNGNPTHYFDWKSGIPQRIKFADGTENSAVVDGNGWITSVVDELGSMTSYQYDLAGRMTGITYPADPSVAWLPKSQAFAQVADTEFGIASGHWRRITSHGNRREETYFDALWRPVVTKEYDVTRNDTQRYQRFSYDHEGRVIFSSYLGASDDLVNGVWTEYDAIGRVTSTAVDSEHGLLVSIQNYLPGGGTSKIDPLGKV